ncbi:leukocyte immunoglobulin-like receptor subfamily A member 2 [Cricetulus griseus]|uniref:Leukocyte immunoglobulin-like receptor subfamily A member 2 n=1 Tax=Cricetulus griseus TaxID=10029 RepID=A0A9J7K9A6_CRIGR|nr:leukocyte immunoglobulin-like receptor subfamily A member 2 [Cricetulus griseus]
MSHQLQKAPGSGDHAPVSVQTLTGNSLAGLSLDIRIPVLAGSPCKPTLRALPNNVVAAGNQMTFLCEGPLEAKEYHLYKEGSEDYLVPMTLLETENRAMFSISSVQWNNAGHYWCGYKSPNGSPEHSVTLELVVTGVHPNSIVLSAIPSPVVTSGGNVTLQCESQEPFNTFILMKDDRKFSSPVLSKKIYSDVFGAQFTVGPVTANQRWRFTCYGYYWASPQLWSVPSNHLELLVSGRYSSKLTLSAFPSPVVTPGRNINLHCGSQQAYDRFILMKDGQMFSSATSLKNIHRGLSGARFRVGPVTPNLRWRFTCYGYYLNNSQVWSVSSNDIQLLVSGNLHKPSIWAQPGSVVSSGSSVTIWCGGPLQALTYVIHKEGSPGPNARETQVDHNNRAKFSIPSVSSLNAGRYNCYSYSSAGWTERSDILELMVTGVHDGKPTLSALPSPVVTTGGNETLQCMSSKEYDWFILTGADLKFSRSQKAQFTNNGQFQALFPEISEVYTMNGPFRCYGYYTNSPYVWSEASNPLEIHVSDSQPQDHTVENLIRMGISGLILTVLAILLFSDCRSERTSLNASHK